MIYRFVIYVNPFLNAFFLTEQYINFSLPNKIYISPLCPPPVKNVLFKYFLNQDNAG